MEKEHPHITRLYGRLLISIAIACLKENFFGIEAA